MVESLKIAGAVAEFLQEPLTYKCRDWYFRFRFRKFNNFSCE